MDDVKLAITINNAMKHVRCAICGKQIQLEVGPELFVAATWSAVCLQCGRQHGRELVALIEAWRAIARAAAPYHYLYSGE